MVHRRHHEVALLPSLVLLVACAQLLVRTGHACDANSVQGRADRISSVCEGSGGLTTPSQDDDVVPAACSVPCADAFLQFWQECSTVLGWEGKGPAALNRFRGRCLSSRDRVVESARAQPLVVVNPPGTEGKGAIDPRARMGADGVLHLTYGSCVAGAMDGWHCDNTKFGRGVSGSDAWYVQSRDGGGSWSAPLKLNGMEGVSNTMGERGPVLSLASTGEVHVVWNDLWFPGAVDLRARYVRSVDGGRTFSAPIACSDVSGTDGLVVTAEGQDVLVFWHDLSNDRVDGPDEPAVGNDATWLYLARSRDGGVSFEFPSERLAITAAEATANRGGEFGAACSMCAMSTEIHDGRVHLAFRSAAVNIRDHWVLSSAVGANSFTPASINYAWPGGQWTVDYCPMNGPELAIEPASARKVAAFTTGSHDMEDKDLASTKADLRAFFSVERAPATQDFGAPVGTPRPEPNERYPIAAMNRGGRVLMAWNVGPMATDATATVKWALYEPLPAAAAPAPPAQAQHAEFRVVDSGTLGSAFSGTKPHVLVGHDDRFYLTTTAVGRAGATYTGQGDAVAAEDREHATPAGASLGGPGGGH